MKTTNILKILAFAFLMLAILLTTACSNINDNEDTDKNGYSLPVTVNVTHHGDEATTKATYTVNGHKGNLSFSDGDQLFVEGNDSREGGAGRFAGTLDYVDGSGDTFSGTITTEKKYTGSADALFKAADVGSGVSATLLPVDYEEYGYFSIEETGYKAVLHRNHDNAFTFTKKVAVEQFSYEYANSYSSSAGFGLNPNNIILNFSVNGLTASSSVDVLFKNNQSGDKAEIRGTVTTDNHGTATFAVGVVVNTNLTDLSLNVDGREVTLPGSNNNPLVLGKIYNVTRTVEATTTGHAISSAAVGEIICDDGKAYAGSAYDNLPLNVKALARVCYVNDSGSGLALALADEGKMSWNTAESKCEGKTPTVTGCTWKFADLSEMDKMVSGAGGYVALRDGFSRVGGTNMQAADYWVNDVYYYDTSKGIYYNFSSGDSGPSPKDNEKNVRACLAWTPMSD